MRPADRISAEIPFKMTSQGVLSQSRGHAYCLPSFDWIGDFESCYLENTSTSIDLLQQKVDMRYPI